MPDELGRDGGYRPVGYCFLVNSEMTPAARRNVEMQLGMGIETGFLPEDRIAAVLPEMNREGVAGVIYEKLGGYADPVLSTQAYVEAFIRGGGVVNAAGPWAGPLAASAGLTMPMRVVREQDTIWEVPPGGPLPAVSVSNGVDAIYLSPAGDRRFVIGRGYPKDYIDVDPYNYKATGDDDFIADVRARALRRFPPLPACA